MKWLFRFATQRALAMGSNRFAALSVVLALLRFVRKLTGSEPRTLYKHELKTGEVLVVSEPRDVRNKR